MSQTNLKRRRTVIKASCTRIKSYVESISDITPDVIANLTERKEKLSEFWSEYNRIQCELETLDENEGDDRGIFEDMFFDLTATIRRTISNFESRNVGIPLPSIVSPNSEGSSVEMSHVRLPKLNLPKFSGKYEDWFPFHDMFNSMIHNNSALNESQKFQYLKTSVTGDAADIIRSLELTNENYRVTWGLLTQRYDNKRTIVQLHVRALFELPSTSKENAIELRRIADSALKHIHALKALQCPINHWDTILIHLLVSKLDTITIREWQTSLTGTDLPTFEQFVKFLNHRCQTLESVGRSGGALQPANKRLTHIATVNSQCTYCGGNHPVYHCQKFAKLTVPQRFAEVRKRKLCVNCLRSTKHTANKCHSGVCKICSGKHNSLLHFASNNDDHSEQNKTDNESAQLSSEATAVTAHSSMSTNYGSVLLSTAVVFIKDSNGNKQTCHVLLDSGSQANFMTRSCAERLRLKSYPSTVMISGINGTTSNTSRTARVELYSRFNKFSSSIDCVLSDHITDSLPSIPVDQSRVHITHNVRLADPDFHRCSDIDLLIGAELFWQLICVGQIKACRSHPTLQKTHLGWIMAGRLNNYKHNLINNQSIKGFYTSITNVELHDSLTQFW
ncbi:PREDICTED: uncharacterized protein LOC108776086 [Cyphomyrmex costatus]|uniref:uncharacterized protein LOC108776086 n=1 Tax=Cyphomyrmex costatus TaxID=456900 RepID=UPI000852364E|nr:PREDICTED: uncharacterized protein LOC108776086 [Cyphomyrmex costatus]